MNEVKSLNQRIAEAFGYRVEWRDNTHFVLIRPDGTEYGGAEASRSEVLAAHYWDQSEAEIWQLAPDYEHSLDAVAEVLPVHVRLLSDATHTEIWLDHADEDDDAHEWDDKFAADGTTRAEAAANALLKYATWKKDVGAGVMDEELFFRIHRAASEQYPEGVVVKDGETLYGFRKTPRGKLVMVHPALASVLMDNHPVVTLALLFAKYKGEDT